MSKMAPERVWRRTKIISSIPVGSEGGEGKEVQVWEGREGCRG